MVNREDKFASLARAKDFSEFKDPTGYTPTDDSIWGQLQGISKELNLIKHLDWQESVITKTISDPTPLTPVNEDRYIILSPGAGAWTGRDNQIAQWSDLILGWEFTLTEEGMACWIEDVNKLNLWNGSAWVAFGSVISHAALLDILPDDHHAKIHGPDHYTIASGGTAVDLLLSEKFGVTDGGVPNLILTTNGSGGLSVVAAPPPGLHAGTHISGGGDAIAGNSLSVAYIPVNYAAASAILSAHLTGIDTKLGTLGSALSGAGSPYGSLSANFGQHYYDTTNSQWWVCRSNPSGTTWDLV